MALHPFGDFISALRDGIRWALRVKEADKLGSEQIAERAIETLPALSETITVYDTTDPIAIDFLEFASNEKSGIRLIINPHGASNNELGIITKDALGNQGFYPVDIIDHVSPFFDVLVFDENANEYKFALKRQLYLPQGARIQFRNYNATEVNAAVSIVGRKYID